MLNFSEFQGNCEGEMEDYVQWENMGDNIYMLIEDEGPDPVLQITFSEDNYRFTTSNTITSVSFHYVKE